LVFQANTSPMDGCVGTDRAALKFLSLSTEQIEAIAKDTRLPGEIGCTYGLSAAVGTPEKRVCTASRPCFVSPEWIHHFKGIGLETAFDPRPSDGSGDRKAFARTGRVRPNRRGATAVAQII
jgi:hypothetical protein